VRTAGTTAATNLEKYIKAIATAAPNGTKVNVVWPNVPPMQSIPDFATASAAKKTALDLASKDFKTEQAAAAARLRGMFANLNLRLVDVHQYFTDVVAGRVFDLAGLNVSTPILDFNSFSGLGFSPTRNAAVPNGADPDSYIFWDKVHPTARFHDLIGELAQNAIPTPGVVVLVGVASVYAGQRRRRAA
jgi:phospholipase/lecithinase/hemolysin